MAILKGIINNVLFLFESDDFFPVWKVIIFLACFMNLSAHGGPIHSDALTIV